MKRVLFYVLITVFALLLASGAVLAEGSDYAGSETCVMCHSDIVETVEGSIHGQFAVDAAAHPDAVPGNYEGGWPKVLGFNKEDVRYVLLPKAGWLGTSELVGQAGTFGVPADDYPVLWASVELGHGEHGEWIIEGEAAGEGSPWLSTCAGCHVTGLKVPTKDNPNQPRSFVELGITCENCHGPSAAHVNDPSSAKPHASTNAELCGQCHERGASVAQKPNGTTFGYPYSADGKQYVPGDDLTKYYKTSNAKDNPKDWWPTGHAKNSHHMQYPEWLASGHAKSLEVLKSSGHASDSCLECHSADAIVSPETTLATAKNGLTCVACHDSHDPSALRKDEKELCGSCHNGEGSIEPGKAVHHPTKEFFEGNAVAGMPVTPSRHLQAGVNCQDCHMPKVTDNPAKGSHIMKVVKPQDGLKNGMPDSCSSCHRVSPEYLGKRLDEIQNAVKAECETVKKMLDSLKAGYEKHPLYLEAKLNYDVVMADGSMGFHNPEYAKVLLEAAKAKLSKLM